MRFVALVVFAIGVIFAGFALGPATAQPAAPPPSPASQPRRIPFWPDAVPAAIQHHTDGDYALTAVRALGRYHRVQGSPGFRAAADWVTGELTRAGYTDARVESLPADGTTRYAHFLSYPGWTATAGKLEQLSPSRRVLGDFATQPVALADYSQDADATADLIDVGSGADDAAYQGKDVRGKIVLAAGPLAEVHRLAVEQRGALGIVSSFPNQRTAWSGLDRDLVRWGHLSPYAHNAFAFMISPRTADQLKQDLAHGAVRLAAHIRAKQLPASYDIVSATIAGTDPAAGDIVLTAHLCHELAGANDNASGSAALLAAARALRAAIADKTFAPPRRTIRFLWLPEISGSQAWLVSHPDLASRLVAGVHLDMVGGRPEITHAALHLSRTAGSLPHIINEIARAWVDDVATASTRYAETGEGDGITWPTGTRDALVTDLRPLELGSDHEVFEAFGVPMVYFHDWPDVTIHTNKDVPDNLDATKLGRVAYMTAGIAWTLAALPAEGANQLAQLEIASYPERTGAAMHAAHGALFDSRDVKLAERQVLVAAIDELLIMERLWPDAHSTAAGRHVLERQLHDSDAKPLPSAPSHDDRIPERTPAVRGPLDVYYYDHLAPAPGRSHEPSPLETRRGVLAFEALNFVDGKRTVTDIRDALLVYQPVPLAEVTDWLDRLAKAGVIRFRSAHGS